jgi:hypothetical protein
MHSQNHSNLRRAIATTKTIAFLIVVANLTATADFSEETIIDFHFLSDV